MKKFVLLLVLLAICLVPSQSQQCCDVSDAEMAATSEYSHEYYARKEPVFAHDATSLICVKQMKDSNTKVIHYWIFIKNTGETELTNVTLIVTPPPNVTHKNSNYFRNPSQGNVPISALMHNRDGTTKSLVLNPRNLNTGDLTGILVTFDRQKGSDSANDHRNAVEVKAMALNPSEKQLFEKALIDMASIDLVCTGPIENGNVTTYNIEVHNDGKTRLICVVLNATLPEEVQYRDSKYNSSQNLDSTPLPKPSEMSDSDGTKYLNLFLGDIETRSSKSIDLNFTCGSSSCPNLSDEVFLASGWTLAVNRIPIKVTSNKTTIETKATVSEVNRSAANPDGIVD